MEEGRIYKFINKENNVSYLVTAEELKVLSQSYEKERYSSRRQYYRNNTYCFSDLDTEEYSAEEVIGDKKQNTEEQALIPMLIEELFKVLTPMEQKVVLRTLIEGYHATELEEEFQKNSHEICRYKRKAIKKMESYLANRGVYSYKEALVKFLDK